MADNGNGSKALTESALEGIQSVPPPGRFGGMNAEWLVVRFAGKADSTPPWYNVQAHDAALREFWPSEPILAGAVSTVASQYSARTWFLDGPSRTVKMTMAMLESADQGRGMVSLFLKTVLDLKSQNNGAFWGIPRLDFDFNQIRTLDTIKQYRPAERALEAVQRGQPLAPVTTIEHLDSAACYRTGNPLYPVLYRDPLTGNTLWLPWHLVVPMAELPMPGIKHGGIQLCAVSRVLRMAQIMQAHEQYKLEKITGRSSEEMHLISGVNKQEVKDQLGYKNQEADDEGLLRWQDAVLVFGINPERPITTATLSLKSTGGFGDLNDELQWYITTIALCFLETYQTFAPLPTGSFGHSQESVILAEGAMGKGPALWEKMIAQVMHQYAIVPRNCEWRWGEKSIRYEKDLADLTAVQLDNMVKLKSGLEVPKQVVYQIMADKDIVLDDEYLAMMGEQDQTDDVTVADDEQEPDTNVEQIADSPTDNAALKALYTLRRAFKASEAEGIVATFSETVHQAVAGYVEGTLGKRAAQNAFTKAINEAWPAMGQLGYEEAGGDWAEVEEEDSDALEDAAIEQVAYAVNYFADLPEIKEEGSIPDARTDYYVQSLRALYAKFKMLGAGNKSLTWQYGDSDHCDTCLSLDGQKHGAKWWLKHGYIPRQPGSETLDCKGFNCQCALVDSEGNEFTLGG